MEYTPSFRDRLYADVIPSFSHAVTEDQKYGIPELNKFPMPDAAHVRSAIKFFNYVTPDHEQQLASAILARMQEYGISADSLNVGDENRFKKYFQHDSLMHHGIKGQKWGVRRFQNPDGSYTSQGKRRRTSFKSKGVKSVSKHLGNKWNSMDPKIKKNIIKGATTLAYIGGISAYGHSKGGKGALGSYMTGVNEIAENNPLSKAVTKRINKRLSKHVDGYDLDDMGPTIYRKSDGKVVNEDDIW